MKKLELADICRYLPYRLKVLNEDGYICSIDNVNIIEQYFDLVYTFCGEDDSCNAYFANVKPVLRPLSDLYRTITHNGKEIVPVVECARKAESGISFKEDWVLEDDGAVKNGDNEFEYTSLGFWCMVNRDARLYSTQIRNIPDLYDYLHELKIDYRGLIDAKLAIDVNTLENNPYK